MLDTRQVRRGTAPVPDLLTVEEAALVLRIGRTKAYAMAREWRATGGRSGLPVVDFGNVLRVPRHALEELIGAHLDFDTARTDAGSGRAGSDPAPIRPTDAPLPREQQTPRADLPARTRSSRARRASTRTSNQLDLFEPTPLTPRP